MTTAYPVSGGFIRLAGHFVDDAFGFMAGYNCEQKARAFEASKCADSQS
jgi:amino acid permease